MQKYFKVWKTLQKCEAKSIQKCRNFLEKYLFGNYWEQTIKICDSIGKIWERTEKVLKK